MLLFKFDPGSRIPDRFEVMATSEQNSYGLATGTWFDGSVSRHGVPLYLGNKVTSEFGNFVKIYEMNEYFNIKSICSTESYYECLAKRFANVDFTEVSNPALEQCKSCSYKKVCCPFRLSFADDSESIPLCESKISSFK